MPIELSPLSSRTEDIPLLIDYFKNKLSEINGVHVPNIDIKNNNLYAYNWPGNVRELRNLVERITILSSNESKENINKLVDDILNSSSKLVMTKILLKSLLKPFKRGKRKFWKRISSKTTQKTSWEHI